MPGGVSPDLLQPGPSFAPISATTTSSATSPADQNDHARLGLVTHFYCSTQPGGLQPAIATGRSVVAQAPTPAVSPGVPGKLGTIKRSDGTAQATYNGHPLYTYIGDTAPGQARGNNINLNGGLWHEMAASG